MIDPRPPHGIARAWDRYWFADVPLTRLAAFRILIVSLGVFEFVTCSHITLMDAMALSAGQTSRPWNPIFLFEIFGLEPIEFPTARVVYLAGLIVGGMAIAGFLTRISCLAFVLIFLYWSGLAYSFGKVHHEKVALTFALMALPLAPVGARLSLDALLRGAFGRRSPETSPFAGFPIRLTQLTIACGYFFAGATKLAVSGIGWCNGYTLMAIMMGHDNEWSRFFSQSVLFCSVLSAATLFLQTTFPLVLVWPRLRWIYIPGLIGFHTGTWQTMDTGSYITLWFTLVAFLPLERVPAWIAQHPVRGWSMLAATSVFVAGIFHGIGTPVVYLPAWALVFVLPGSFLLLRAILAARPTALALQSEVR